MSSPSPSHPHFTECLQQAFAVPAAGEGFALRLIQVDVDDRPPPGPGLRQPFALLFRGPAAPVLSQGQYELVHDGLGTLSLFLVPVGPDAEGLRYEAVFA